MRWHNLRMNVFFVCECPFVNCGITIVHKSIGYKVMCWCLGFSLTHSVALLFDSYISFLSWQISPRFCVSWSLIYNEWRYPPPLMEECWISFSSPTPGSNNFPSLHLSTNNVSYCSSNRTIIFPSVKTSDSSN